MIHPPHLTLYAIVAATTCGASLVFLVFVSLYSIARLLVHLTLQPRERGEGRQDGLSSGSTRGPIHRARHENSRRAGAKGVTAVEALLARQA